MKNILVAIDLEANSKNLLVNAKQLAEKFGSKVWIIHIIEHQQDYEGVPESFQFAVQYVNTKDVKALEHKKVEELANSLIKKGIKAEGLLIEGPTVKVIMDEAIKLKIDLIIMGSHKQSFLYEALFESTTASIIRKSNIPILVVPI